MKHIHSIHRFFTVALIIVAAVMSSCKEDLYVNEYVPGEVVIKNFFPEKASIDSDVTIEGENLNMVDSVWIGGRKMGIHSKVSSTKLIIRITAVVDNQQIVLFNKDGSKTESGIRFRYDFDVVPQVDANDLPNGLNMYKEALITGLDLRVVTSIKFLSGAGFTEESEAEILSRNDMAILIRIPFVQTTQAKLTLEYPTGISTNENTVPIDMNIGRNTPEVSNAAVLSNLLAGGSVTLNGLLLDIVDLIKVGGVEAEIVSKKDNELTFNVPTDGFPYGENPGTSVTMHFFDGRSQTELSNNSLLFVPNIYIWSNRTVNSRKGPSSFFGFDTGIVYNNSTWGTAIDPVAYSKFQREAGWTSLTCSAANIPQLTTEVYNSVKPYFMLGKSGATLNLISTTHSNDVLQYVWVNGSGSIKITQGAYCSGTPVINFIKLDPTVAAEKTIIDKVVNQEVRWIDDANFHVDVATQKLAGVNINKRLPYLRHTDFAPGITWGTATDEPVSTVVLIIWMNNKGFDASAPVAANINKFGFMHIKRAKLLNEDEGTITFDMYWPKEMYQY